MSLTEIALVLIIALILFGPDDLPVIARAFGKIVFQVRKYTNELGAEFKNAMNTPEEMINQAFKNTPKPIHTDPKHYDNLEKKPNELDKNEEELLTYEDSEVQNDTRAGE